MADITPLKLTPDGGVARLQVGDVIPVANGGTGATTASAAAAGILPSQTGHNGKVLSTDGTNISWSTAVTGYTGSAGAAGYTGSRGESGLGFSIAKTYSSVSALQADTSPVGIFTGQFAIIETGDNNNAENSRLYLWNGSSYTYTTDLSGAAGITGATGYTGSASTAAGPIGYTGSAGTNGYTGSQGGIGFTGSAGSAPWVTTGSDVYYDTGKVGVGITSPLTTLHAYASTAGTPETTGSGTTGVTARFQNQSVNIDIGTYANGNCFIQPRLAGNNASNFHLILNPNGGNVSIGRASSGQMLEVEGTIFTNSGDFYSNKTGSDTVASGANLRLNAAMLQAGATGAELDVWSYYGGWKRLMRMDYPNGVRIREPISFGYGTGAGGTVTQATSKSTAVTLNKPTGQITMHAEALAAGASVTFILYNTYMTATDVMVVTLGPAGISELSYNVWAVAGTGQAYMVLKNVSTGSLSNAVTINFAIIKGATA